MYPIAVRIDYVLAEPTYCSVWNHSRIFPLSFSAISSPSFSLNSSLTSVNAFWYFSSFSFWSCQEQFIYYEMYNLATKMIFTLTCINTGRNVYGSMYIIVSIFNGLLSVDSCDYVDVVPLSWVYHRKSSMDSCEYVDVVQWNIYQP